MLYLQMVTLLDGCVLVIGGRTPEVDSGTSSCELFNPSTSTFSLTGNMAIGRYFHRASLLPSGKVLVTGGDSLNPPFYTPACQAPFQRPPMCPKILPVNSTEIFDPVTATWTTGPTMPLTTAGHDQITMPSGRVLITDGEGLCGSTLQQRCAPGFGTAASGTGRTLLRRDPCALHG